MYKTSHSSGIQKKYKRKKAHSMLRNFVRGNECSGIVSLILDRLHVNIGTVILLRNELMFIT